MNASSCQLTSVLSITYASTEKSNSTLFCSVYLHRSNSQINCNYQIKILLVKTLDVVFVKEISAWLYSFVTYIETSDEANDSMEKLMQVIAIDPIIGTYS